MDVLELLKAQHAGLVQSRWQIEQVITSAEQRLAGARGTFDRNEGALMALEEAINIAEQAAIESDPDAADALGQDGPIPIRGGDDEPED